MLTDHRAQQLLFGLLEARAFRVTRRAIIDYHGAPGQHLLASGLLEPVGYETNVLASDEDEPAIYHVTRNDARDELGYRSSSQAWLPVAQRDLEIYRPRIGLLCSCLLGDDLRQPKQRLIQVEQDLVWEVGQLRIIKSGWTAVWFARRLTDHAVQEKLRDCNSRHPASGRRLILTSTPHERLPAIKLEGSTIVPVVDVLDPYSLLKVDFARLRARFTLRTQAPAEEPLHLSEDGSVLTILGTEIVFGGPSQRRAISIIVEAHRARRGG